MISAFKLLVVLFQKNNASIRFVFVRRSGSTATKIAKTDEIKPKAEFSKAKKETCHLRLTVAHDTVKTTFYVLSFASSLDTLEDSRTGEF